VKRAFGSSEVQVPIIGQGSWQMGVHPRDEAAALLRGVELGLTHLDTAELYGQAEDVVGEVVRQRRRDELFLVSKVLPQNADRKGTLAACERSLKRLGTDHLDVYLLHWQGSIPLEESMRGLEACVTQGKTRFVGVSNLDLPELEACVQALGATKLVCNQVYYDLEHRGIERRLLPWCRERGIALVAYSPFGSTPGRIPGPRTARGKVLHAIAAARGATAAQVVLAFLTRLEGTFAIPKASKVEHVEDNARALGLRLTEREIAQLDEAFPAPPGDVPLATL
jgi:diketogulonate reductase-like aldo/keto reductase